MSLSAVSGEEGGGPRWEYDALGEKWGSKTVLEPPGSLRSPQPLVPRDREVDGVVVVGGGGMVPERVGPDKGSWWGREGADLVRCRVM